MPEISKFLGIIIRMYYGDHAPPHFHAIYGEYTATFSIKTGKKLRGKFPKKQEQLVTAWAILREKELKDNWKALSSEMEPKKIEPLK